MNPDPLAALREVFADVDIDSLTREEASRGWLVPDGMVWCPRCGDINYDEKTRVCITCTEGDAHFKDGAYRNGWLGADPDDVARFEAGARADHDANLDRWHDGLRNWAWGRERGKDSCPFCRVAFGPMDQA